MINMPTTDFDLGELTLQKPTQEERTELGQEDFLMLMVEQFSNQDPFQPVENGEFIAQMAQFSQVSGIAEMNQSLERLANSMSANQALQAATMVGRSVLAEGNLGTLGSEDSLKGGVDLPYGTNSAYVRVFNPRGEVAGEFSLGTRGAGLASFEWDGTLAEGERAEPGTYRVAAFIRNDGIEEPLATYVGSEIQSVSLSAGGRSALLTTANGQQVSLSQVKAIM